MMLPSARKLCTISRNPDQLEFLGTLPTKEEIAKHWRDKSIEKYREVEKYLEHDKESGLFVSKSDHVKVAVGVHAEYNLYTISDGCPYEHLVINAMELLKLFYGKDLNMDVHHINGIKTDDRKENIKFMQHEKHMKMHRTRVFRRYEHIGLSYRKGKFPKDEQIAKAERKHFYRQIIESVEANI